MEPHYLKDNSKNAKSPPNRWSLLICSRILVFSWRITTSVNIYQDYSAMLSWKCCKKTWNKKKKELSENIAPKGVLLGMFFCCTGAKQKINCCFLNFILTRRGKRPIVSRARPRNQPPLCWVFSSTNPTRSRLGLSQILSFYGTIPWLA